MKHSEFSIISHYFNREYEISRLDVNTCIGDDCALLNFSGKKMLAISTDTLVCGRHFLPNINPADLAFKAIAVNISDLSAVGADPAWLTLSLTLPEINEVWLKTFSDAFFEQLCHHKIQLIGGDTTSGPLSITLTIYGFIPVGFALKRSGANPGDWIYVTGTLGDSAAGLAILQNRLTIKNSEDAEFLVNRHLRPTPRIIYGKVLRNYASSAIDLSDGLSSDLSHILNASGVGAKINIDSLPFSTQMNRQVNPYQALYWALSGGEDYELCCTVPNVHRNILHILSDYFSVPFTCIGKIVSENKGISFFYKKIPIKLKWQGYDHFK